MGLPRISVQFGWHGEPTLWVMPDNVTPSIFSYDIVDSGTIEHMYVQGIEILKDMYLKSKDK